jgi:capsular exopolysaccharide synthesis family protein
MELRRYLSVVRKWFWLVIACTLLAGGLAFFLSRNSAPVYQASATLMVNQASNPLTATAYSDILTSERLARTYASLLISRPVLEETARRLGVDVETLRGTISVTPVRETQLLEIQVEGSGADLVAQIANTLPQVFIDRSRELQLGRVSESKANLEKEISNTEADLARTQAALNEAINDTQRARLETSLAQYRSTYSTLVASYQQVKLAEAQASNNLVVAESAGIPDRPIRPRPLVTALLAAVFGALVAIGAAYVIDYLDDTVKTPDDVTRVSGLPTLGAIARLKEGPGDHQLVASAESKAPESEAYRTLRTNIQFSSVDRPTRTLLVTSSGPSEGKSTTAANLAVVMAQTGKRVIAVDADLRRPVLHRVFGVPNNTGITTALLAGDNMSLEGHLRPTKVENLSLLTSGPIPPNPSEILGSHRMASLIESLTQLADIVIFDSPPVLAVTDAAVLGRQVDGVVLVVDARQTREQVLARAVSELQNTGANLLGVVLNRLDSRAGGYYYYYYYYSGEEGGQRRGGASKNGNGTKIRLPRQRKPV